jgi:GDP-L-fucose synthase
MMQTDSKIYVAGHRGLVGSALMRQLKVRGYANLITRTHVELDLTNSACFSWAPHVFIHSTVRNR